MLTMDGAIRMRRCETDAGRRGVGMHVVMPVLQGLGYSEGLKWMVGRDLIDYSQLCCDLLDTRPVPLCQYEFIADVHTDQKR